MAKKKWEIHMRASWIYEAEGDTLEEAHMDAIKRLMANVDAHGSDDIDLDDFDEDVDAVEITD